MIKKCMQHILGHCINRDRQTPDIGTPPSVCTVRLALSSPPLPSSTFDANYTICPPSISWDRTMPVFSLSLNLHTLLGTHMHSVSLFERCATTPLTELQTGSLSSLLGLEIAPPSLSVKIPSQHHLMSLRTESCRWTCVPLRLHHRHVF